MTTWQTSTGERLKTLESDHRSLLVAFGAAFVLIMGAIGGAYLGLSAKMDMMVTRIDSTAIRIDSLATSMGEVKADVAVLRSDVAALKQPAAARS